MRRSSVLYLLVLLAAACGSDDLVDEGGECGGGKECKPGLFCDPRTQTCQRALVVLDARPVDAGSSSVADARLVDAAAGLNTTITGGPTGTVGATSASFTFTCSTPPCTFECALDAASFAACTSPREYSGLAPGGHTFRVRAIDGSNAVDPTPAEAMFTVVLAPVVQIASPANDAAACDSLTLTFDTVPSDAQVTYTCTRNGTPFTCGEGGVAVPGLVAGSNTIVVTARDANAIAGSATVTVNIDRTAPTLTITAPASGATACPAGQITYTTSDPGGVGPVTAVDCTITPASGAPVACAGAGGVVAYANLAGGAQTVSLRPRDACGNTGDAVTRAFTVDRTGPTIVNLSGGAGPQNSGGATLTFAGAAETLADAEGGIAFAPLPLPPVNPTTAQFAPTCDCGPTSCACGELAAGVNQLAVRGVDACGNVGGFTTTLVNASYGPYAGHEVQVGHSYVDAGAPAPLAGNAAALTPWVHDDLAIGRQTVRVLAFRGATVPEAVVTRVTAAIQSRLAAEGVTWRASNGQQYREISDPSLLPTALRGRDVFLVYDQLVDAFDYSGLGQTWGPTLAPFLDDGGVAVSLGSAWPALNPIVPTAKPAARPGIIGGSMSSVVEAYPASLLGTGNFALTAAMPAGGYAATDDLSCVGGDRAAPVYDLVSAFCGDGCSYSTCPVVTDERFPGVELSVAVVAQPAPGLPDCAQPWVGVTSGAGTIALAAAGPTIPSPRTVCYAGGDNRPAYASTSPRPYVPCTVTSQGQGTFTIDASELPEHAAAYVTLLSDGEPLATARASFFVDDWILVSSLPNGQDPCTGRSRILEFGGFVDGCSVPTTLPFQAIECVLEKDSGGGFAEIARKAGSDCNAVPDDRGGFASSGSDFEIVPWYGEIFNAGAGTYRMTLVVTDFHGNVVTEVSDPWVVTDARSCG